MKFFDLPSMYSLPGIQGKDCAEVCQGILTVSARADENDKTATIESMICLIGNCTFAPLILVNTISDLGKRKYP
ncbi:MULTISPECIES: hypothetical protein [Bradyrhizobium]|uniref:hypothetical protein n=1 Tax=Bradyrhizobium TaxID=374 RepID=UPI000489AD83|nr:MULTISPECIES: hypothetical protein [Bradyrhizobium]MBR0881157.1 hypothetical protein [Bradyrhizobium liaoningense]MBR1002928.1 hypothetical protein [Bradyrhizobium liaoningense]MBR1067276.1 hypothetical protein [Bradyrhizobium liaoningense]MDI2077321.1 hypothetical protein [Bradyrhizobium sp. Mp27]